MRETEFQNRRIIVYKRIFRRIHRQNFKRVVIACLKREFKIVFHFHACRMHGVLAKANGIDRIRLIGSRRFKHKTILRIFPTQRPVDCRRDGEIIFHRFGIHVPIEFEHDRCVARQCLVAFRPNRRIRHDFGRRVANAAHRHIVVSHFVCRHDNVAFIRFIFRMRNFHRVGSRSDILKQINAIEKRVGLIRVDNRPSGIQQFDSGSANRFLLVVSEEPAIVDRFRADQAVVVDCAADNARREFFRRFEIFHHCFREVVGFEPAEIVIQQAICFGNIVVVRTFRQHAWHCQFAQYAKAYTNAPIIKIIVAGKPLRFARPRSDAVFEQMLVQNARHHFSFRAHRIVRESAIKHQRLVFLCRCARGIAMNGEKEICCISISFITDFVQIAIVFSRVGRARHHHVRSKTLEHVAKVKSFHKIAVGFPKTIRILIGKRRHFHPTVVGIVPAVAGVDVNFQIFHVGGIHTNRCSQTQ